MTSILVTGSSRGIGLEIVKRIADHPDHPDVIIATCRDPSKARELTALAEKFPYVKILQLDVDKVDKFPDYVSQVSSMIGENGLNILINNAGIYGERFTELGNLTYDFYLNIFKTNLFGPVLLTQAFLPLLKKAGSLKSDSAKGFKQVAVLNVSSFLGSVSSEKSQFFWVYSESKAALNQATRGMATNFNSFGILALALHPGWVKTDLGGPNALLSVEESGAGLMNIITNLNPENNDKFLRYDGSEIPW